MEVEEDAEAEKEDLKVREARKKVYCTLYSVTFVHTVQYILMYSLYWNMQHHPCHSETITFLSLIFRYVRPYTKLI